MKLQSINLTNFWFGTVSTEKFATFSVEPTNLTATDCLPYDERSKTVLLYGPLSLNIRKTDSKVDGWRRRRRTSWVVEGYGQGKTNPAWYRSSPKFDRRNRRRRHVHWAGSGISVLFSVHRWYGLLRSNGNTGLLPVVGLIVLSNVADSFGVEERGCAAESYVSWRFFTRGGVCPAMNKVRSV